MKKNSLSVRTISAIAIFIVIALVLLYLFQIQFLDVYYENYQVKTIERIAGEVNKMLDSEDLVTSLETIAYENDICIRYSSSIGEINYNNRNTSCVLQHGNREIIKYINNLRNDKDSKYLKLIGPNNIKSIIYLIEIDEDSYIVLSTNLESLDVATKLLREQLVYIIVFLIMIGVIFSIIVTKQLNKPILTIINSAKELEKGNYDVKFEGSNVAELNELADVLTVAASEMKNTDELRRDLIANVSHDLKTPLTMIKAYAEKVRDLTYKDDEKREKDLNVIISESDRLNGLVNDLLNLSKLESNSVKLTLTEYDLRDQISDVLKRYDIVQEKEGYIIELDIPDEPVMIKADRARLDQVLYNLINNAIEHTGDDKKVYLSVKPRMNHYTVSVTDTGKGIKKDEIPLVWNRYYTNNKNHKRNVVGTGLGLNIVKTIFEKHGYEYGIDTKVGKYTRFYFRIKKNR